MTGHQVYRTGSTALLALKRELHDWPMAPIQQQPPTHRFSIAVRPDLPYDDMRTAMRELATSLKAANCHALGAPALPPYPVSSNQITDRDSGLSIRATAESGELITLDVDAYAPVPIATIRALLLTRDGELSVTDVPPTDLGGPPPHVIRRPVFTATTTEIVFTRKQLIAQRGPIAVMLYEEEV